MTLDTLTTFFGWMVVLNITVLTIGSLAILLLKDWAANLHSGLFRLEAGFVRQAMYEWLGTYKVATFIFSIVPYLALRLM